MRLQSGQLLTIPEFPKVPGLALEPVPCTGFNFSWRGTTEIKHLAPWRHSSYLMHALECTHVPGLRPLSVWAVVGAGTDPG